MYGKKIKAIILLLALLLVSCGVPASAAAADEKSITVDGNGSDWSGVPELASNTENTHVKSLKVTNDAANLYFCIEGDAVLTDPGFGLFMNTDADNSTGYQSKDWNKSGYDFYFENDTLYKYSGDGSSWDWTDVDLPDMKASDSAIEIAIPMSELGGLKAGDKLGVAYDSIDSEWTASEFIPGSGSNTPDYTISEGEQPAAGASTAAEPAAQTVSFSDENQIPSWAKDAVHALAAKGIVSGTNNKFNPNNNVTRAEFVRLLTSVLNIVDTNSEVSFTDVKKGDWFYSYIASAAKEGIISSSSGKFAPNDVISRQDMAVMLSKALYQEYGKIPDDGGALDAFADKNDIAANAREGVATAVAYGLMSGVSNGRFAPEGAVTRAQSARVIYTLLENYADQSGKSGQTGSTEGLAQKTQKPWNDVTNYACYYAKYDPKLSNFDVAIIDAREMTREQIQELRASGTYVIAYITVGERDGALEKGNGKGPGGYASYYIDDGKGAPAQNGVWKSYYVNAGDPDWQDEIINQFAKAALVDKGCDGVFLDTVDTAEMFPETADGMVDLIKKLHDKYPDKKMVVNRGMYVLPKIASYISGMMFESFSHDYDFDKNEPVILGKDDLQYTGYIAVNQINAYRKENNFRVFSLDYVDPNDKAEIQKVYDRAWEYDFIPYASTINLDQVFLFGITPKSERGVKEFTGEATAPIGPASTDPKNLALASNGTTVTTDSNFPDYGPNALNDGHRFDENMFWAQVAWASDETPQDHWALFTFPKEKEVNKISIYWAYGDEMYMTPKQLKVQVQVEGIWVDAKELTNLPANSEVTTITLDEPVTTNQVRILQPSGKGSDERPDLMWAYEIEMY